MEWCCLLVIIIASIPLSQGRTLTEIVSHYNTLNKEDFHDRIFQRCLSNNHDRDINFFSHGRTFHMKLVQSRDIFDSSFHVVSVNRHGKESPVHINMDYFYKGYIEDDPTSQVTAHVENNGVIMATIDTANDTYFVEPMWRLVDASPSHDMIVYKASDIKWNLTNTEGKDGTAYVNTCGNKETDEVDDKGRYFRRGVEKCRDYNETKNACELHLVADYNFFVKVGRKDVKTSVHYMLQVINRVDNMFRNTCWDNIGKGVGVQVNKVTVHNDMSTTPNDTSAPTYNSKSIGGEMYNILLDQFSRGDWDGVCLAHLFTYQDFDDGVVGLAYVAYKNSSFGGICSSPKTKDDKGWRTYNCGFSTYQNWGRTLTLLEATLVTAHEMGHGFGSGHDHEEDKDCAPDDEMGNYVMYPSSLKGNKRNNNLFSPCSRYQVGKVLKSRNKCLVARDENTREKDIVEESIRRDECKNDAHSCCKRCHFNKGNLFRETKRELYCAVCMISNVSSNAHRRNFVSKRDTKTKLNAKFWGYCPAIAPLLTSGECNISRFNTTKSNQTVSRASVCEVSPTSSCCWQCTGINVQECNDANAPCNVANVQCDVTNIPSDVTKEGVYDAGKRWQSLSTWFKELVTNFSREKVKENIMVTILSFSLLISVACTAYQFKHGKLLRTAD